MSRPDLSYINHLHDLFIAKYERYLPTAFSDNLTLLQKVNMVIERMNQIGEITNELVDKWNEINEWILNDGLNEAVEKEIKKLVKDGTIASLLNDDILNAIREEVNGKVDIYDYVREINRIDKRIDDVTVYPDGVPKNEIVEDVINTINRDLLTELENEVTDGNFTESSSYYDNFVARYGRGSLTENHTAILTSLENFSGNVGGTLLQEVKSTIPKNEVWYARTKVKSLNTGIVDLMVGFSGEDGGESLTGTGISGDIGINNYYTISHLYKYDSNKPLEGKFNVTVSSRYPFNFDKEGKSIEIENVMAINLTKIFGRGKEPSKEIIDKIISFIPSQYFDGKLSSGLASTTLIKLYVDSLEKENTKNILKNEIRNSLFIDGNERYWTTNGSSHNYNNNKFTLTGIGSSNLVRVQQVIDNNFKKDDELYLSIDYSPLDDVDSVSIHIYNSDDYNNTQSIINRNFKLDGKNNLSGIIKLNKNYDDLVFQVRATYGSSDEAENKSVIIEKPMLVNLTESFGKNREPVYQYFHDLIKSLNNGWLVDIVNREELLQTLLLLNNKNNQLIHSNDKSFIKNYLNNPTFNRDILELGWTTNGSKWSFIDKGFVLTGLGQALVRLNQKTNITVKNNRKLYVRVNLKPKNNDVSQVGIAIYGSKKEGSIRYILNDSPENNVEETLSGIVSLPDDMEGNVSFQVRARYPNGESSNDKQVEVKNPLLIDLTELFGEGNEPEYDVFNKIIENYDGFIDGNASVKKVNESHLKTFLNNYQNTSFNKFPILVPTFDDGFESDLTVVYPLFESRGIKGTSFINGGHIGNKLGKTNRMSWEQLKELRLKGWDIQDHYFSHPDLTTLNEQEIREQITDNTDILMNNGFNEPEHSAYPYGYHNATVRDITMEYRKTVRRTNSATGTAYNTYEDIQLNNLNGINTDMHDERPDLINTRKKEVDETVNNNGILIWYSHRFTDNQTETYQTKLSYYEELLDYALSKGMVVMTMTELYNFLKNTGYINE